MTQTAPTPPLFYSEPTVLRFPEHRHVGLRQPGDFAFAAKAVAVPLTLPEFALASRSLPIVFAQDEFATPLAVTGLETGQNLFVDEAGRWKAAAYVPAYLRRFPFIAVELENGGPRMLGIETSSPLVVQNAESDDERLFDGAGSPTDRAKAAMALCEAYAVEHVATQDFVAALTAHKLLVPRQAELNIVPQNAAADGSSSEAQALRSTLTGFQIVDEAVFQALDGKVVAEFHKRGWLAPVILHLASQHSWQTLLDAAGARTGAASTATTSAAA